MSSPSPPADGAPIEPTPPPPPVLSPASLDPTEEAPLRAPEPLIERRHASHLRRATASGLTADGRLRSGRLAGMTMRRAILVLSWPILVESFLNSLVGLTDTVLAAGLEEGRAATDAIGAASNVLWLVGLVVMALCVGATALASRAVGAGRLAMARAVVGQTTLLSVVTGLVVGAGLWWSAPMLASMYALDESSQALFVTYIRLTAPGVPFIAVLAGGIACLRAAGDSLRPLWAVAAVNAVNITASWMMAGVDLTRTVSEGDGFLTQVIAKNPSPLDMGVSGIALGTILGQAVGALIIVRMLTKGVAGIDLRWSRLRPHRVTLSRILRIGSVNFIETMGMWIVNTLIVLMVVDLAPASDGLLGAHIVAIRIEAFSFLPGFAMGVAGSTLMGQYLGAGSVAHARRAVWACVGVASATMGCTGVLFMAFPVAITGLFTPQAEHLEVVPELLFITGTVQLPFAVSIVLRTALRGAGDVRGVMVLTWATLIGVRLPIAYALSGVDVVLPRWLGGGVLDHPFMAEPSLAWLWIGLCVEVVIRGVAFLAWFLSGRWVRARL